MGKKNFENVLIVKKSICLILMFNINFSGERAFEELLDLLRIVYEIKKYFVFCCHHTENRLI